jgi:hypothetical protein
VLEGCDTIGYQVHLEGAAERRNMWRKRVENSLGKLAGKRI